MKTDTQAWMAAKLGAAALVAASIGCVHRVPARVGFYQRPSTIPPLGTLTDPIFQAQEDNAEPAKFIVFQHEWQLNTTRLNWAGEDHVKQIASRLIAGQNFPVMVERSDTSAREATEYKYPVHVNSELDMKRREVLVHALMALGVPDANQRTFVAPNMAKGFSEMEGERAYYRTLYGGQGGGFGGFGGQGAFGGGGGAGFGGMGGGGMF